MKLKLLLIGVVLSSLIGYLEWGQGYSTFLFQGEYEVLGQMLKNPKAGAHPFVLLPMLGQLLLILAALQVKTGKWFVYGGILSIGILLLFIFVIGIASLNWRITLSTIPFFACSVLAIRQLRKIGS